MRRSWVAAILVLDAARAFADPCERVPVWRDGRPIAAICRADATERGLAIVELGDDWVPPIFDAGTPPPAYRATYLALAAERWDAAGLDGALARTDRYLELFGVEPTLAVVRDRLADDARHACHAEIDRAPLALPGRRPQTVRAVQEVLACDRLPVGPIDGIWGWRTEEALATFQRGAMIVPTGELDAATRTALARDSRERDADTARRVLRARIAAAGGLVEDGTGDAPDRLSAATDAAARALGWRDPAAIRAALADPLGAVAIALPPRASFGELSAEITGTPRPTLTLYAQDGARRVALVRLPTTIGGWQDQLVGDAIVRCWKGSPAGPRVWRDVVVAPRWLAPKTTPDRELEHDGAVARELFGPSYRSAFGLVALVHVGAAGDEGIRTHATGNLASLVGGASHGCHRILGADAVRLADFLLAHHGYIPHGDTATRYRRTVAGTPIRLDSIGYRIELVPPIPVDVSP